MCHSDPLSQTHRPACSNRYFHFKIVLFCETLKSGNGRKNGLTDKTCENSYWL